MSGLIIGGAFIAGGAAIYTGNKAAKASRDASRTSSDYQMAGLNYMMDQEEAPTYYRDQALAALASEYGLSAMPKGQPVIGQVNGRDIIGYRDVGGDAKTFGGRLASRTGQVTQEPIYADEQPQQAQTQSAAPQPNITEMAMNSPLYNAIMGGRDAGEQAIARTSNATGGLRGGQSVADMATFNRDLNNRALMESRNSIIQGLGSFAGMPSNANAIAGQYNNIGNTLAQGQIAGAQAKQQGFSDALQGIGTGISAYYGSKI